MLKYPSPKGCQGLAKKGEKSIFLRILSLALVVILFCGCLISCYEGDSEPTETTAISSTNDNGNENSNPDDSSTDDPETDDSSTDDQKTDDSGKKEESGDKSVIKVDTPLLDAITANTKHKLYFREDGTFKVLVLSDVQYSVITDRTKNFIKTLVDREDPNLIIFDGDNCRFQTDIGNEAFKKYVADMVEYIEEKQIPWCHVYGNHDSEQTLSKERQQAVYESFEYCISRSGPVDINGIGNYVLPVYSSDGKKIQSAVWCLDSGMYTTDGIDTSVSAAGATTDYIRQNQVDWYKAVSAELAALNGGIPVYGMMAFHIPLQENRTAWNNREELNLEWTGEKRENVYCSNFHSTLFEAIKERGDVKAIVNGHDHINDYALKYQGVWLAGSGRATDVGYTTFAADMIGGRVVVLNEKNTENLTTYMSYIPER